MHLKEAFRGLIEPNRWPTAAIFLEMDPTLVDVNVHPQKSEVRFRTKDAVWRLVNLGVANALATKDIVATYKPSFNGAQSNEPAAFGTTSGQMFDVQKAREAVAGIELPTSTPLPTILASSRRPSSA